MGNTKVLVRAQTNVVLKTMTRPGKSHRCCSKMLAVRINLRGSSSTDEGQIGELRTNDFLGFIVPSSSPATSVPFRRAILANLPFKNIKASSVVVTTITMVSDPKLSRDVFETT
jgi:hypothetical protein